MSEKAISRQNVVAFLKTNILFLSHESNIGSLVFQHKLSCYCEHTKVRHLWNPHRAASYPFTSFISQFAHKQLQAYQKSLRQDLACLTLRSPYLQQKSQHSEMFFTSVFNKARPVSFTWVETFQIKFSCQVKLTGHVHCTEKFRSTRCKETCCVLLWYIIRAARHGWCYNGKQNMIFQVPPGFWALGWSLKRQAHQVQ